MRRLSRLHWGLLLLLPLFQPALAADPVVRLVEFDVDVNVITANRITRAIDDAEAEGDDLILIRLDTPGGYLDALDEIVQRMLASEVPIVVWVGPSGARAASAGFFMLMAADVAAMAPGTRTGAASTVMMGGENKEGDVLLKKANEDMAALIRSIAKHRGRNVEACERAVMEAKAYEESVALDEGLIDLVAKDRDELLALLDSREITRFDGSTVTVRTAGARFAVSRFPWRQKFMEVLTNPIVVYLLLLGGLAGIYVEFTHPGMVFPGVVGALCLLLFALSFRALPISAIGLLLILLGIVMFVLEIKVTSYGMLTVGGVVCLVLGSVVLVEGPIPELRIPLAVVLPASLTIAAICAFALRLLVKAQSVPPTTGADGLAGETGRVTVALDPEGKVFVHGEIWNAASAGGPIPQGGRVRIVRVDNMQLTVEPAEVRSDDRS
jgi:membrane-bound serine protease (ClpP class)